MSRWKDGQLTNYDDTPGMIGDILEDKHGQVWVPHFSLDKPRGSLCRVIDSKLQCYGKADEIPFNGDRGQSIGEDAYGNIWIGSDTAILRWKPRASHLYALNGLRSNVGQGGVVSLAFPLNGPPWAGTAVRGPGLGLLRLANDTWKPFVMGKFDGSRLEVLTLLLDHAGSLWVGTARDGIYRVVGDKVDHFGKADGLSSDSVLSLYEDREGNIWAVTTRGLDNFRDLSVATYSTHEGLAGTEVDSLAASRDGTVWIGSAEGLNFWRDGALGSIRMGEGLPGTQVTAMVEDHMGRLWTGVDNTLRVYQNGRFRLVDMPDKSPTGLIHAITEDTDHNIWAEAGGGSEGRLLRIRNMRVLDVIPVSRIPTAQSLAADAENGIWLGLWTGDLARYRLGKLETFTFRHGSGSTVRDLLTTKDGDVLGATQYGLIAWGHGRQQTLTVRNGLPCDRINAMALDSEGGLWLNAQCGLIKVAKRELDRWWLKPDSKVQITILDALDGLETGVAPFNAGATSVDGRLWFSSGFALLMIDPQHLAENHIPPPVHVERIIADRRIYLAQPNLLLPSRTRDIEVDYTALSYVSPQKVRFRYRLVDHDADWQDAGTRRQAFYNDLPPGKYRFRVVACNNAGVWNEVGAALDFSLLPAWYQTAWFRLLCVVLTAMVVWSLHRIRLHQIASAMNARFDERVAERTRLARELHDTMLQTVEGSKMLADVALDEPLEANYLHRVMERLSICLGHAIEEERAAITSLRLSMSRKNDLVEDLQRVIDECSIKTQMQVEFTVHGVTTQVHPIMRDEIYRIGYEAIRNAYQHSGASRIQVQISYTKGVVLTVVDNGRGIDPVVLRGGRPGHFGLQGMTERAQRIGGVLDVTSTPGAGTRVELIVPAHVIFPEKKRDVWNLFLKAIISRLHKSRRR
ncbi:sensor histidine kinase [Acidicapsa ligni]|uniref:sensor histidine kinase n=1 Tax=Acidicapsa ligni TaxID=542300 RepID=UPI0021E03C2D|nr:sensor histidine kinase [Acidicapsa ligni]